MKVQRIVLAAAGGLAVLAAAMPARADSDDWRRHEWREQQWRAHEAREREWRRDEWREHHQGYVPPPPVIYRPPAYAAPPVYAPAPGYVYR